MTGAPTMLVAPLQYEGKTVGVIMIRRRTRVRPFAPNEVVLLKSFADQAAIAIDHARLSAELEDRDRQLDTKSHDLTEALEQQTATSEILRVISGTLSDVTPVFEIIAENAARLCAATDALVALQDGEALVLKAHHGDIPAISPLLGRPINRDWVAGRAMIDRRTVHVEDVLAVRGEFPLALRANRTVLATPLLRDGEPIGALVIRRTEVRPFTANQITLLETFAAQAVIAIENVRLFKELETRNRDITEALDRQTATAEVLRVISSSPTDLGPVFDAIIKSAVRLSGANSGGIFRYDGQVVEMVGGTGGTAPLTAEERAQPFADPPPPRLPGRSGDSRATGGTDPGRARGSRVSSQGLRAPHGMARRRVRANAPRRRAGRCHHGDAS